MSTTFENLYIHDMGNQLDIDKFSPKPPKSKKGKTDPSSKGLNQTIILVAKSKKGFPIKHNILSLLY